MTVDRKMSGSVDDTRAAPGRPRTIGTSSLLVLPQPEYPMIRTRRSNDNHRRRSRGVVAEPMLKPSADVGRVHRYHQGIPGRVNFESRRARNAP